MSSNSFGDATVVRPEAWHGDGRRRPAHPENGPGRGVRRGARRPRSSGHSSRLWGHFPLESFKNGRFLLRNAWFGADLEPVSTGFHRFSSRFVVFEARSPSRSPPVRFCGRVIGSAIDCGASSDPSRAPGAQIGPLRAEIRSFSLVFARFSSILIDPKALVSDL